MPRTPAEKAEYLRQWRALNRERRNAVDRARYAAKPEASKAMVRAKARRQRGRIGAGVSFTQRRLSRWKKRSFAEMMSEYTYQQARGHYERWCDEIEAEMERRSEMDAAARAWDQAAAQNRPQWSVGRWSNEYGFTVWSSRRPLDELFT